MAMLLGPLGRRLIPLLAGLAVMTGCQEKPASDQQAPPFVLRSLSLNQLKPDGSRDWDLSSPEARYDPTAEPCVPNSPPACCTRLIARGSGSVLISPLFSMTGNWWFWKETCVCSS